MVTETELKLQIAHARDLPRLLAHPRLAALEPQRERLVATYFDTPALDLLRARMAVRERREGRRQVATVKTAGLVIGGLSRRGEWEAPMPAGVRRFAALVDDRALADWLRAREGALQPVFRTAFTRLRWQLAFDGARVEVALDHGAIVCDGPQGRVREPLLELELEVLDGPDDALFALALELAEALPLWPLAASKAERGYALFLRAQGSKPPSATPQPRASWSATTLANQVFAQLAHEVLDALAPPLRDTAHTRSRGSAEAAEAVHQSRVALRRLRALLGVFAPALPAGWAAHWRLAWGELARALGAVRDLDVLRHEVWPLLAATPTAPRRIAGLQRRLHQAQARAWQALQTELVTPATAALLLRFARAVHALAAPAPGAATATTPAHREKPSGPGTWAAQPPAATPIGLFARERLRQRRRRVRRALDAARASGWRDAERLHALRIEVKKLRYATEALAATLGGAATRKARARLPALEQAQSALGRWNDVISAGARLATLAAPPRAGDAAALTNLAQALTPMRERAHKQVRRACEDLDEVL
ncbi:MAG: hypothetical protein Fur0019_09230 [Tibeticola sp.]